LRGVVKDFDDHKGFGTISADDGGEYFFHCTALADGTRDIEEGAAVTFEIVAGRLGRWEAADVNPISGSVSRPGP